MRVLSNHRVTFLEGSKGHFFFKSEPRQHTAVVLHIHGGGFVSMSSQSHQLYTNRWANELGVPIFSVDYRKSPEHPFPAGLDDVFQVYCWVLHYCKSVLNIDPLRILLVGDSAGGNLVAALTLLCVKYGLRMPTAIFMSYPALNLNYHNYTPSLLISLEDFILPHTFLKYCLSCYIREGQLDPRHNFYLSPVAAPDSYLKEFPPTHFFVGSQDPLEDDSWRLFERLLALKVEATLTEYRGLPHGFLQFGVPNGLKESHNCVKEVREAMQAYLK